MNSPPQPFNQSWTADDTQGYVGMLQFPSGGSAQEQHAWRENILAPQEEKLSQAIGRHVAWLMGNGRDVAPAHSQSLKTPFLSNLRALQENKDNTQAQYHCGRDFYHALINSFFFEHHKREQETAQQTHDALTGFIEQGDFGRIFDDHQTCFDTGLRLQYQYQQWKGACVQRHYQYDEDLGRDKLFMIPLKEEDITPPHTLTAQIPVPSGRLLIADWFRIPAFNELTRPLDDNETHDAFQSVHGRAQVSRRYAEQLGVVHVFCKSPSIVQSMGAITAGTLMRDEDFEAIEPKGLVGKIDADLRWTTIADPQHLVLLLSKTLGHEEAQRQVDDYVRQTPDIIQVQVAPGTHHAYFSGSEDVFRDTIGQEFASEGLFLEDFEWPGLALTQSPLQVLSQFKTNRRTARP